MKCDEIKPTCGPCAKGNRACLYGALPTEGNSASEGANVYDAFSPAATNTSHQHQSSMSTSSEPRLQPHQWPTTSGAEDSLQIMSPQSSYSTSTGYGAEVAPLRWFGLLAGDAANGKIN